MLYTNIIHANLWQKIYGNYSIIVNNWGWTWKNDCVNCISCVRNLMSRWRNMGRDSVLWAEFKTNLRI